MQAQIEDLDYLLLACQIYCDSASFHHFNEIEGAVRGGPRRQELLRMLSDDLEREIFELEVY